MCVLQMGVDGATGDLLCLFATQRESGSSGWKAKGQGKGKGEAEVVKGVASILLGTPLRDNHWKLDERRTTAVEVAPDAC